VTNQLLQIFPNTSIFPVLGNHDEHPKDNFPADFHDFYKLDRKFKCNHMGVSVQHTNSFFIDQN
jgi:hypothetical protein